jgi:hypothetical protein
MSLYLVVEKFRSKFGSPNAVCTESTAYRRVILHQLRQIATRQLTLDLFLELILELWILPGPQSLRDAVARFFFPQRGHILGYETINKRVN